MWARGRGAHMSALGKIAGISIATLGLSSVDSVESDLRMIYYILANLKSVKSKKTRNESWEP